MVDMGWRSKRGGGGGMSGAGLKAPGTTARKAKRKSATAKEAIVRMRRSFLRKRLAKMSPRNFMRHLLPRRPTRRLRRGRLFRGAAWYRRAWRRPGRG